MTLLTTPIAGVNFTDAKSSADWTKEVGLPLGTIACGADSTEFIAVTAAAAITQYDCVTIDENFEATASAPAGVSDGHRVGFAQTALTANQYGWVAIKGTNIKGRFRGNVAADKECWTTATAGVLDDASASGQVKILGATAVAAGGSSAGANVAVEVIATWPHINQVGVV